MLKTYHLASDKVFMLEVLIKNIPCWAGGEKYTFGERWNICWANGENPTYIGWVVKNTRWAGAAALSPFRQSMRDFYRFGGWVLFFFFAIERSRLLLSSRVLPRRPVNSASGDRREKSKVAPSRYSKHLKKDCTGFFFYSVAHRESGTCTEMPVII